MYKEYEFKVGLMADLWIEEFHHRMTQRQIRVFQSECKIIGVSVADVLSAMLVVSR